MDSMEPRWTPGCPSGVQVESRWTLDMIWLGLLQRKVHVDSMWTPQLHVDSCGVQVDSMGEGKVLALLIFFYWLEHGHTSITAYCADVRLYGRSLFRKGLAAQRM